MDEICVATMIGKKYIKAGLLSVMLIAGVGFALSRLSFTNTVKATVTKTLLNTEATIGSGTEEESDLEEGSSPAYFNIFRFISNLVPSGSH